MRLRRSSNEVLIWADIMRKFLILSLLFASAIALGQTISATSKKPNAALMSKVFSLWLAGDTAALSPYYDHAPTDTFFSLLPLQYQGWDEYKNAPQRQFTMFRSFEGHLNSDATVLVSGATAWGTATWKGFGRLANGNGAELEGRWTVIWQKKDGRWLIVHDHFSVPWTVPDERRAR